MFVHLTVLLFKFKPFSIDKRLTHGRVREWGGPRCALAARLTLKFKPAQAKVSSDDHSIGVERATTDSSSF